MGAGHAVFAGCAGHEDLASIDLSQMIDDLIFFGAERVDPGAVGAVLPPDRVASLAPPLQFRPDNSLEFSYTVGRVNATGFARPVH